MSTPLQNQTQKVRKFTTLKANNRINTTRLAKVNVYAYVLLSYLLEAGKGGDKKKKKKKKRKKVKESNHDEKKKRDKHIKGI